MIAVVLLVVSWVLLRREGKGLSVLGFDAPGARLRQLAGGLLAAGLAAGLIQLGKAALSGVAWVPDPAFGGAMLLEHLRLNVNSVLFEELLFRGYLFYQALRFLGTRRAVLLDAAVFGVYHWFTFGVLGNPTAMVVVFFFTGAAGCMFALAFARTRSLALPVGLHLGWNGVNQIVFTAGPWGGGWLVPAGGAEMVLPGAGGLLLNIVAPLLFVAAVCAYLLRARPYGAPTAEPRTVAA